MNKFLKLLSENENAIRILLVLYALYCSIVIGVAWDEIYYHKIGKINLNYLLSFGLVEGSFDQKYRYSTLYWSFGSLLSQSVPEKYHIEVNHIINTIFGLMVVVGCYQIVKKIFNKTIAKTSSLFLLLLPFFFGHLAINNKDVIVTFAHVWIVYYLIKYTKKNYNFKRRIFLISKISILSALGTGIQLLFLGSLIPLVIIFFSVLFFSKKLKLIEIILDFSVYILFFYFVLILFWVDTHSNILVLPINYFMETLSLKVGWPYNLVGGEYTFSSDVSSMYLLINYLYKLPEFIIFLYIITFPILIYKYKRLKGLFKNFNIKIILIIILLVYPNLILIFINYSIYDGIRLFLWAVPYLTIIPAITVYCILNEKKIIFSLAKIVLIFLFIFHLFNFIKITPYHYTFLNYLSGDVEKRYKKFENDYWSTSLKELILSSNLSNKKISYTVCGVNPAVAKIYMSQKYKNVEYTDVSQASYIIMTNRTLYSDENQSISNCFDKYDYKNVAEVKRNGLILSAIKKLK